jgi:hypothetical protein
MAPWATVEKRRSSIQGGDDYYGIKMDFDPRRAEEYSGCIWELEPVRDAVKPTIRHEINRRDPKFIEVVSGGWPRILCLETGEPLEDRRTCGQMQLTAQRWSSGPVGANRTGRKRAHVLVSSD